MKNLLLFDIDETLIFNNGYPSNIKSLKKKIKELYKNFNIGICTNRAYDSEVKTIMNDFNIKGIVISESGACIYLKSKLIYKYKNEILNKRVINILKEYKDIIYLNPNRINSSTLYIKEEYKKYLNKIIKLLKNDKELIVYKIDNLKVAIMYKGVNKIKTINNYFNNNVIFITDYEKSIPKHKKSIKIYSVGKDNHFNKKCDKTYESLENVLEELRRE